VPIAITIAVNALTTRAAKAAKPISILRAILHNVANPTRSHRPRAGRVLISAAIAGMVMMAVGGCAAAQQSAAAQNSAPAQGASTQGGLTQVASLPPAVTPTNESVAAAVNGRPITLGALNREVQRRLDGIRAVGDALPADLKAFRATTLDNLIDQVLIEQEATAQKITVSDEEVEREYQENLKIAGSRERLLQQLNADRLTEAEYRAELRTTLLTSKMRDRVVAGLPTKVEQVHARHILVATEAQANDVLTRLRGGTDFAALAKQFSLDTSTRDSAGDLGWFARGDLLEPSVEEASFALEINQISAPIKSNLGYHIVQLLERVKDRPLSPEAQVRQAARAFETWLQGLRQKAKIEKFADS
jgi:parvulin-like peptidyl-prolyl isomerase